MKKISGDLYLYLGGKEITQNNISKNNSKEDKLENMYMLSLLYNRPNIGEWKNMNEKEFVEAMGKNFHKKNEYIKELEEISQKLPMIKEGIELIIKQSSENIMRYKKQKAEISKKLEKITETNEAVQSILKWQGKGIYYASSIVSEIIDIKRFRNDDAIASYCGLGMSENKTGRNENMKRSIKYNRILKGTIISAALSYILWNPNDALSSYYKSLIKRDMSPMEAQKRIARAFVRKIYKTLKSIKEKIQIVVNPIKEEIEKKEDEENIQIKLKKGKGEDKDKEVKDLSISTKPIEKIKKGSMASGINPVDNNSQKSNIPPIIKKSKNKEKKLR